MKYTDIETKKSEEQHRADIHRKIKTYLTKKRQRQNVAKFKSNGRRPICLRGCHILHYPLPKQQARNIFCKKTCCKIYDITEDKNKQEICFTKDKVTKIRH